MAALPELRQLEVLDLTQTATGDLDAVLNVEIGVWSRRFDWDFRPSADLLRRLQQIRSLYGFALRESGEMIGYSYFVIEGRKGLIGNFFVLPDRAGPDTELPLLAHTVEALMRSAGVRRVESQLMLLRTQPGLSPLPWHQYVSRHDRHFMQIDSVALNNLVPVTLGYSVEIVPWSERHLEEMAHLLPACYRGHVDSEINDQYRSIPGARQFLNNIVRFPGCGYFCADASKIAIDPASGRVCGMCLTSLVSETSGHITQVCVLPALRGSRIGYELLRQSLSRLSARGCKSVSLTVTAANQHAVQIYRSMGFQAMASFPALVWEGF